MYLIKIIIVINIVFNTVIFSQPIELPIPSGEFKIGTKLFSLIDSTRYETFIDETLVYRELTAKVWYPAEDNQNIEFEKYFEQNKELHRILNLNDATLTLMTHSKKNLSVLDIGEKHPILIFNHGWGEHFLQNTILMEELASNGYVVFSLAHHYECKFSIYPDNKLFILNPSMKSKRLQEILSEQTNPKAMQVFEKMFKARDYEDQDFVFQKANDLLPMFFIESPRLWSEDISFLIDQLMDLSKSSFKSLLDLERIGVLGMSMGGIAAQQFCNNDNRVKAAISMDGGFYGDSYDQKISQPFMFINSHRYISYEDYFLDHLSGPGYVVTIPKADHYNFHDISIMDRSHQMLGEINGGKFLSVLNELVLNFFNK